MEAISEIRILHSIVLSELRDKREGVGQPALLLTFLLFS